MFTTILFDIDGTIIDTEEVIISSLQKALLEVTGRSYSHNDLRFTLGIPSATALARLNLPAAQVTTIKHRWPEILATMQRKVTVFANMRRTLAHLQHRGIKMAIITSKSQAELANEFTWFGLNEYFDVIVTATDCPVGKPAPDPILLALSELHVPAVDALYLGDSLYDMQSAKAAGTDFALATWGAFDLVRFDKADYMLQRPESLLDLAEISV